MSGANRNSPCPCGSGKKYKKCCALKSKLQKMKTTVIETSSEKGSSIFAQHFSKLGESYTAVSKKAEEKESVNQPKTDGSEEKEN